LDLLVIQEAGLVLEQIQIMHDISDEELNGIIVKKMKRLEERLRGETK
jgi:hypothetical protein